MRQALTILLPLLLPAVLYIVIKSQKLGSFKLVMCLLGKSLITHWKQLRLLPPAQNYISYGKKRTL